MTLNQTNCRDNALPDGEKNTALMAGSNDKHDQLIHWLVNSLELEASLFHIGQYCGDWRASTSGRECASFHLILRGNAFLHIDGHLPVQLSANEGIFLLKDIPHFLTPDASPPLGHQPCAMRPMQPEIEGGMGLACGFFHFKGLIGDLLKDSFPDFLLIRANSPACQAIAPLFSLILSEAERNRDMSSPLIERLTELLFFYVVREIAQQPDITAGLWAVACRPRFSPLIEHLLNEPGKNWSLDEMAHLVNMSRASFCRHFTLTSGQPPAQFLLQLRMKIAAQRLRNGETVTHAAEHVGYESAAAFTRAFKKIIGEQPGSYQRSRRTPCRRIGPANPVATIKQKTETERHRANFHRAG